MIRGLSTVSVRSALGGSRVVRAIAGNNASRSFAKRALSTVPSESAGGIVGKDRLIIFGKWGVLELPRGLLDAISTFGCSIP